MPEMCPDFISCRKCRHCGSDGSGSWVRRPVVGEDGGGPRFVRASNDCGGGVMTGSDRGGL